MTQNELKIELEKSGFPTVYNNFTKAKNPPYVIFISPSKTNVSSDSKIHGKFKNYNIELYTKKKDLDAEKKLEDIIGPIDPDYETLEVFIETEKLYQVTYSITIFEKVGN
jgi:hypothetical protein